MAHVYAKKVASLKSIHDWEKEKVKVGYSHLCINETEASSKRKNGTVQTSQLCIFVL